nr:Protein kinase [Ipomoea batatas]
MQSPNLKSFTFADLKMATRDFRLDSVLGEGGFGPVFKGWIDKNSLSPAKPGTGLVIAVKRLNRGGLQGHSEWLIGHLSAKSDVYSFGVVLLEMLSGRRVIDYNRPCGEHNLVEWAKPYLANKRKVSRVLDNRLEGQYTLEVSQKVANLALQCLSKDPRFRPTMDDVVKELEQLKESKDMTILVNKHNGSRHRRRSDGAVKELAALEESKDTTTLGSRHRRRSDGDAISRNATTVDCLSKTINIPSVCQINEGCF